MLHFDFSKGLQSSIGEHGVGDAFLSQPDVLAAFDRFKAFAASPELRFTGLPELDTTPIKARAAQDAQRFTDVVVLGIGGSSLGAKAAYNALVRRHSARLRSGEARNAPRLHFVENIDGVELTDLLDSLDLETTSFNVVTKSGSTIETMSAFFVIRERLVARFGVEGYRERMVATTDPKKGELRAIVEKDGLFALEVPPGVGGRFSVLTAVGLYPLAVAGLDIDALLAGARWARDNALAGSDQDNVALAFAAYQIALYRHGKTDVVLMPYATAMADCAAWFVQLWAESLGKLRADGVRFGPTPICAVGATDQHSQLQLFMEGVPNKNVVFVELAHDDAPLQVPVTSDAGSLAHLGGKDFHAILNAELRGVRAGLQESGRPTSLISLARLDARTIGALFMMFECATAFGGYLLQVDPFDQPGVELGKLFAHGLLGKADCASYRARYDALAGRGD